MRRRQRKYYFCTTFIKKDWSAFKLSYLVDFNESSEKRKLTLTGYLQDDFLDWHNVLLKTATIQFKFKFDG